MHIELLEWRDVDGPIEKGADRSATSARAQSPDATSLGHRRSHPQLHDATSARNYWHFGVKWRAHKTLHAMLYIVT